MVAAAVSAIAGAGLTLFDVLSRSDEQSKIRCQLHRHWETVRRTPILNLPKRLIQVFLSVRHLSDAVTAWVAESDRGSSIVGSIAGVLAVAVLIFVIPRSLPLIVAWAVLSLIVRSSRAQRWRFTAVLRPFEDIGGFLIALGAFFALLSLATAQGPTFWSAVPAALAVPIGPVVMDFVDDWRRFLSSGSKHSLPRATPLVLQGLGIGVSLSALSTTAALALGNVANPSAALHLSYQMLISNVIFDGLTLTVTFLLLAAAIDEGSRLSIGVAVVIDVIVSALFACASLWLGLHGSRAELTLFQVTNVLFARSPDGHGVQLGPYFFLMHTAFLPILAFFFMVFLCWAGKTLLQLSLWLMKRGSEEHVNPIKMSVALCGVFVALFTGMFTVAGELRDRAKAYEQVPNKALRPSTATVIPSGRGSVLGPGIDSPAKEISQHGWRPEDAATVQAN